MPLAPPPLRKISAHNYIDELMIYFKTSASFASTMQMICDKVAIEDKWEV